METEKIARYAFFAFVIIAIVMGLVLGYMAYGNNPDYDTTKAYVTLILLILGIIVGLVSITFKEVTPFLIAAIALIVAGLTNVWQPLTAIHELLYLWARDILELIIAFVAPAAVIIAIRSVLIMAREK